MAQLSEKLAEVLRAIHSLTFNGGSLPSRADVVLATGLTAATVQERLVRLRRIGHVRAGEYRAWRRNGGQYRPLLLNGVRYERFCGRLVPVVDHTTPQGLELLAVLAGAAA